MIDVGGVRGLLPHRYPMLLVDRVIELDAGRRLVAVKAVTVNEPWYSTLGEDVDGERLAYPDVLLVESFAQASGVLASTVGQHAGIADQVMLIGAITGIRFHRPVFPGDQVTHHVRVSRTFDDSVIVEGESEAGGGEVLTVERMVLAFRPNREVVDWNEERG